MIPKSNNKELLTHWKAKQEKKKTDRAKERRGEKGKERGREVKIEGWKRYMTKNAT